MQLPGVADRYSGLLIISVQGKSLLPACARIQAHVKSGGGLSGEGLLSRREPGRRPALLGPGSATRLAP